MAPKGWIEVTQLDGNKQTISIQQIVCVRIPVKDEVAPKAQSIVGFSNGGFQAAKETYDDVIGQMANRHRLVSATRN